MRLQFTTTPAPNSVWATFVPGKNGTNLFIASRHPEFATTRLASSIDPHSGLHDHLVGGLVVELILHADGNRMLAGGGVQGQVVIQFWRVGKLADRRSQFPVSAIQRVLGFADVVE